MGDTNSEDKKKTAREIIENYNGPKVRIMEVCGTHTHEIFRLGIRGRLAVPVINDTPDYKFEIGKGIVLKEGKDVSIFATGLEVSETLEAAKMLAADGIDAEVINIHTIKPIDRELIVKSVSKTGKAVTVEEHSINGGLGSAVAEVLCEEQPAKLLRIGVEDRFGESGPAVELIHKYGLDAEGIYNKVKNYMK